MGEPARTDLGRPEWCWRCKTERYTRRNRTQVRCARCGSFIRQAKDADNQVERRG